MDSKCVVIICSLLLSATLIQGFAIPRGNRCLCKNVSTRINVMALAKLDIYNRSSACENTEYIATLKDSNITKCVSPELREVKALINGKNRHLRHIPVIRHQ
ncbi:C-X-C motif chemokine 11-like [Pseudophryne corroboree]|uniref:C-X-C motif chemokine 11-like n=1 Tax=Pseudophryne corroboree TaxID=495146 RepID=UPI003081AD58